MDCSYVSQADHNCGSCTELARINSLFFAWKPAFIYTTKWPDTHSSLHLAIWVSRAGLKLKVWRRDKYNTTQNTVHSIYVCTIELWLVTYAPCISAHITSSIIHRGGEGNMGMHCDGLCECLHTCAGSVLCVCRLCVACVCVCVHVCVCLLQV